MSYNKRDEKWTAQRRSKNEKKLIHNGNSYGTEEEAARASDTLARKLIQIGEQCHILNFPEDETQVPVTAENFPIKLLSTE